MSSQIKLSIIIPIYNVEEFIEECLNSIILQVSESFPIEIIVVNDGTPDNSMTIVNRIQTGIPNLFRIINQENQGLSMARNNGLRVAKGEYVWFVDSDDYLLSNALLKVKEYIEKYPNIDVFSSFLRQYFEYNNIFKDKTKKWKIIGTGKEYLYDNMPIGASQRFIYKRQFLIDNNLQFQPKRLHEDAIWGYEMLYLAKNVCIIDVPIYVYRIRTAGAIMSSIKIKTAYDLIYGHRYLSNFAKHKVKSEDKVKYRESIFGMILTLLDFCKDLYGTKEYSDFLLSDNNASYITKEAKCIFCKHITNLKALVISINPALFIVVLKIRRFLKKIV